MNWDSYDETLTELVDELNQSENLLKVNQKVFYKSRNKKENKYKLIEEQDYFASRRKKGKK